MDPTLFEAYRQTRYVIDAAQAAIVIRIGEPSTGLDRLLETHGGISAAFVTAYNPFSRATDEATNSAANRQLEQELRDCCLAILPGRGEGEDGSWPPEPSFLGIGIERETAEHLGRKYRQYAIAWVELGGIPELVILFDEPD